MSNFWMRALTGAVFVIVLVGGILWRFESFAILFMTITALGLWEFYGLAEKDNARPQKVFGTIVGTFYFLSIFILFNRTQPEGIKIVIPVMLVLPAVFSIFIAELYRKEEKPFTNIAYTVLGLLYVAFPFSLWIIITMITNINSEGNERYNAYILLGYFILMWTSDTGAYLCGKSFGRTKLFERISPKKTWEGTIGGGILCIAVAFVLSTYFPVFNTVTIGRTDWMIIAAIIVITGNLGDLAESLFKRSINIKDSGTILPGHGGILDRFDAVLVSTPFVFTYILFALL